MASVHDVAAYILKRSGAPMTAMKLQKLCYYAKAWHSVWDAEELFPERIEAWANGPVAPALYEKHRGQFNVSSWQWGEPANLSKAEQGSVDAVVDHYGKMAAYELSELTHSEAPWRDARAGLVPGERGNVVIESTAMYEFYDGLVGLGA